MNLSPAQFKELHYTPTVLLESKFDASITDHVDFPVACEWGYDAYFDEMYQWNADRTAMLFVEHIHTLAEVQAKLIEEDRLTDTLVHVTSVGWRAGIARIGDTSRLVKRCHDGDGFWVVNSYDGMWMN